MPPIRNQVKPPETYVVSGDRGKQIYYAYGCNGCHGDSGLGQYDLRKGPAKYPTDDELIAWIKHPERLRPGIAMPTWDGVIQEEDTRRSSLTCGRWLQQRKLRDPRGAHAARGYPGFSPS